MDEHAALLALLHRRSIPHGDFTLASGARSTYYIDARPTTMSAEGLHLIGRLGVAALRARGWAPAVVGGLTMGADPVAYAVALASRAAPPIIDAFSVRKEAKGHGTRRRVECNFHEGDGVVVVRIVARGCGTLAPA